ncbi:unnamed protein product [Bemisia tabaci]|uniref:Methyltransferase type 11 domain-containing protein n=1 Tax=Bemisia tabaci TaxID=7038 RepID=A0A9P0AIE4_BEMTA|nr:unnamed protein product [Bemisia tabaci]
MANLFVKQAVQYARGRPTYPAELFRFIAEKTPERKLAWDVGTGNGQAARSLAEHYEQIVATDTSSKQLELAPKIPNVRYEQTSPNMSKDELYRKAAPESSVDLVTAAQAAHWFDLPTFYEQVRRVLKKPHGVIAAWCYTLPEVNPEMDTVLRKYNENPYGDPRKQIAHDGYKDLEFPFQPLHGLDGTGPFHFKNEKTMSLDDYFVFLKSRFAYQKAKDRGVELLNQEMIEEFRRAWSADGNADSKSVRWPVYLRIGRVGT